MASSTLQRPGSPLLHNCCAGERKVPVPSARSRLYDLDASIVLIGSYGVGKSTLAVIVSTSLKMKFVDTDRCFRSHTKAYASEYVAQHGYVAFQSKDNKTLAEILRTHQKGSIIAISTPTLENMENRNLLKSFLYCHPTIHIMRDQQESLRYLTRHVGQKGATELCSRLTLYCRSLAQFEFFNRESTHCTQDESLGHHAQKFSSIKAAERDLLGLLRFIRSKPRHKTFLSAPEKTSNSRILMVSLTHIERSLPEVKTTCGVHAIGVQISFDLWAYSDWESLLYRISAVHANLRRSSDIPIAMSVEIAQEGQIVSFALEERYFDLLQYSVALGSDYCYIDLKATRKGVILFNKSKGATKSIGVWHNSANLTEPWWDSSACLSVLQVANDVGCDIVQISAEAITCQDNYAALSFAHRNRERSLYISAFNTGCHGRMSRVFNQTLSPVVLDSLESITAHRENGGEFITAMDAQQALVSASVVPSLRFSSFGGLISHSVAPAMHNVAFKALGLPHLYDTMESLDVNDCRTFLRSFRFGGLSCANPHKETIGSILDSISEEATAIKAVNTVYARKSSQNLVPRLIGENTDWIGITTCILKNLSTINTVTRKTTALVVGAGGMARAAVYACLRLGVLNIIIHNRTQSNAAAVAEHFSRIAATIRKSASIAPSKGRLDGCEADTPAPSFTILTSMVASETFACDALLPTIIVNALPDGVDTNVSSEYDLPPWWFGRKSGGVYIESAYKKEPSVLMEKVRTLASRNWVGVRGKELLSEQAFAQIELWTGMPAPCDIMRKAVL